MKKKIGLGIVGMLMTVCAVVFANNVTTKTADNNCPNKPGCICSEQTITQVVAKPAATTEKKNICPSTPDCICN